MRMSIYGSNYQANSHNTPLSLFEDKRLGFTASYLDNDGGSEREHMMGSVDSNGHQNNQGYLNSDGFGSLKLIK